MNLNLKGCSATGFALQHRDTENSHEQVFTGQSPKESLSKYIYSWPGHILYPSICVLLSYENISSLIILDQFEIEDRYNWWFLLGFILYLFKPGISLQTAVVLEISVGVFYLGWLETLSWKGYIALNDALIGGDFCGKIPWPCWRELQHFFWLLFTFMRTEFQDETYIAKVWIIFSGKQMESWLVKFKASIRGKLCLLRNIFQGQLNSKNLAASLVLKNTFHNSAWRMFPFLCLFWNA